MIGKIRGIILEKEPPIVLVETGGISYEIHMPMTCFYKLPGIGMEGIIFTHFIFREDMQLLFGFSNKQKRTLFREIIKTNGIGPKLALTILSDISVKQFINAIKNKNLTTLVKIPGVGKKIAERLIMEMKDHFQGLRSNLFDLQENITHILPRTSSNVNINAEKEAIAALIALGYKSQEASQMIDNIFKPESNSKTLIYEALRTFYKAKFNYEMKNE